MKKIRARPFSKICIMFLDQGIDQNNLQSWSEDRTYRDRNETLELRDRDETS